jgi:hypothetical protein
LNWEPYFQQLFSGEPMGTFIYARISDEFFILATISKKMWFPKGSLGNNC